MAPLEGVNLYFSNWDSAALRAGSGDKVVKSGMEARIVNEKGGAQAGQRERREEKPGEAKCQAAAKGEMVALSIDDERARQQASHRFAGLRDEKCEEKIKDNGAPADSGRVVVANSDDERHN